MYEGLLKDTGSAAMLLRVWLSCPVLGTAVRQGCVGHASEQEHPSAGVPPACMFVQTQFQGGEHDGSIDMSHEQQCSLWWLQMPHCSISAGGLCGM